MGIQVNVHGNTHHQHHHDNILVAHTQKQHINIHIYNNSLTQILPAAVVPHVATEQQLNLLLHMPL